jgi:ZIP family zinc transporter
MPLGAWIASIENFQSKWLEDEFRHTVFAFGGGALISAVSLVLVPEASKHLSIVELGFSFLAGGLFFFCCDKFLNQIGSSSSNLVAMLSDFVPESLALGAGFASKQSLGLLLAGLIALQNLPEGFNAYRELTQDSRHQNKTIILMLTIFALLGPLAGLIGFFYLSDAPKAIAYVMSFAASGILYLIFQDIAPMSRLEKAWLPALGANFGFLLGLMGHQFLQS